MRPSDDAATPKMDTNNLYRDETFTDRRVGTIRRLTPVKADGSVDPGRQTLFLGQAQFMTNVGALPLNFEINARSLEEAAKNFSDAAKVALERTMKELKELRREAASSIIIPEGAPPGGLGGPGGSGKIKLP
jgi:hypothetical protein